VELARVPKISEFFGIAIYVHWRDHGPSHFHAEYAGEEAWVSIEDLTVIAGRLSPRVLGLVMEWASMHQEELRVVWQQSRKLVPLSKIAPLE
jgi:hypothetical protein